MAKNQENKPKVIATKTIIITVDVNDDGTEDSITNIKGFKGIDALGWLERVKSELLKTI